MSFAKHNPIINEYAQRSPENMKAMIACVSLSIRQQWHTIGVQMADWRENGRHSKYIFGNKRATFEYLDEHIEELYQDAVACAQNPAALMLVFMRIPGIGMVKAGFCCQLWNGSVGCIDSHNANNYDFPPGLLKTPKGLKPATLRAKVDQYIHWCGLRRSEFLWNRWCQIIAAKYPKRWADYSHVSAAHVEFIVADWDGVA